MRKVQWLLGVAAISGTIAAIAACSSDDTPSNGGTTTTDSGTPKTDSSTPGTDSGTVEDSAAPECVSDGSLSSYAPPDAAIGDASSVGICSQCIKSKCATQFTACGAECACTDTFTGIIDCLSKGGDITTCGGQIGGGGGLPSQATIDIGTCLFQSCQSECGLNFQFDAGFPPADASSDAKAD